MISLDHINITTNQIDAMRDFLVSVLDVEEGPRPDFPVAGYWLYLDGHALIHINERESQASKDGWLDHIAFGPFDFDERIATFERLGVSYFIGDGILGTGTRQIFVSGPDGTKIEFQCPAPLNG